MANKWVIFFIPINECFLMMVGVFCAVTFQVEVRTPSGDVTETRLADNQLAK